MKNKLPKTKTVTYKRQHGSKPDWKNPVFKKEEAQVHASSYRGPCAGDSGSGQFILVEYFTNVPKPEKRSKFVLAAVYKGFVTSTFEFRSSKHKAPCGTFTYDPSKKRYLRDISFSQNIRFSKVFTWIMLSRW